MPVFSIIIPAYNNSRYLPECVHSITSQNFRDCEVIIVDDASTDDTYATAIALAQKDERIVPLRHRNNGGTLSARITGINAAQGDYILLVDQDDALAPSTLSSLFDFAIKHPADIYHYGVKVVAATTTAQQATPGMTDFLTPIPRTLTGADILKTQFAERGHFDWHVHHKMYRADLAKQAYGIATSERLLLSDDLYMCFILDALAETYYAIPNAPWYIYHLGRGDTFGTKITAEALCRLSHWESEAFRLIKEFVAQHHDTIVRDDWSERIHDAGTRLIEHTMNVWKDELVPSDQDDTLVRLEQDWPVDMICAELYRFVRDHAYAYFVTPQKDSTIAQRDRHEALRFLHMAQYLEARHTPSVEAVHNEHYEQLKAVALRHLADGTLLDAWQHSEDAATRSRWSAFSRLFRR